MKKIIICLLLILPIIFIYSNDEDEEKIRKEKEDKYYFSVCDQYNLRGYAPSLMWLLSESNINDLKGFLIAPDEDDRIFKVFTIIDDYVIYHTITDSFEEYYFAVKRENGTIYSKNSRFDTSSLYSFNDFKSFENTLVNMLDIIVLKRIGKNEFKLGKE